MNHSMNSTSRIAYFDCPAGICGSMVLGSLIDAGLSLTYLEEQLRALGVSGWKIESEKIVEHGISGTRVKVHCDEHHPHRGLGDIEKIIRGSALSEYVKRYALRTFRLLGEAEAAIHNTTVDRIHFHEVGAVDAIVDICGTWIGLEQLGVERVHASAINTGSGTVRCRHGLMPVPAPATAALLRTARAPVYSSEIQKELTTPTGAALLAAFTELGRAAGVESIFGALPALQSIDDIGYGAGEHALDVPNLLRVTIGVAASSATTKQFLGDIVTRFECNLDDSSPQWIGRAVDALYAAGALEVWSTPVLMKKNRPGVVLSLLCVPGDEDAVLEVLFRETTTIGVRREIVERRKLQRETIVVETAYGSIRVKVGRDAARESVYNLAPEYDDCASRADEHGVALKEVHAAALEAARRRLS